MMRLHYWIALAVTTTTLVLGYTVFSHSALPHLWQMKGKAESLQTRMDSLYDEIAAISSEIELLSDSSPKGRAFLKRVAREELGMVGPGEVLVTMDTESPHEKNVHP